MSSTLLQSNVGVFWSSSLDFHRNTENFPRMIPEGDVPVYRILAETRMLGTCRWGTLVWAKGCRKSPGNCREYIRRMGFPLQNGQDIAKPCKTHGGFRRFTACICLFLLRLSGISIMQVARSSPAEVFLPKLWDLSASAWPWQHPVGWWQHGDCRVADGKVVVSMICRSLMSLFRDCFSLFMFLAADVYSD